MSDCYSTSISALSIAPLSFPLDVAGVSTTYTFAKTSIVSGVDDVACQTFCHAVMYAPHAERAPYCSEQGDPCTCSGDVVYLARYNSGKMSFQYQYDVIPADPSGSTTCSGFNLQNSNNYYDCYCQQDNSQLEVYGDVSELTGGGSTYTINVDTRNIMDRKIRFYCYQGLTANGNFRYATTGNVDIKVECGNVANINDLGGYDTYKEVNSKGNCWHQIENSEILPKTQATSCAVTGLTAYHSISDTSATPAVQVSHQTSAYNSDSYWFANGKWTFDGLTINRSGQRQNYGDIYFYVLLTQTGGGTQWLGGSTPTQFNLFCQPCLHSTIQASTQNIIVDWHAGTSDSYVITDYYQHSTWHFTPSQATNDGADCDAMYFYAFSDIDLTTTWSDPDIVLSPADAVNTQTNLIPVQSALSRQTMTINTLTPFRKQLFIKGLNSGKNFAKATTNVIVCGNEDITVDPTDFVKLDFQKYRAYNHSVGSEYFASQATNDVNYFRDGYELNRQNDSLTPTTSWFHQTENTILVTNSDIGCYNPEIYSLCVSIIGQACNETWSTQEQLKKVQMVGNNLRINLTPFEPVDLFILVYYPLSQKSAFRKINVAVCGNETVHGSNITEFIVEYKKQKVMSKLMYQFEAGSSIDGTNQTFVIDSDKFMETYENLNFTNMYFYSTNPTYCPIFECDIVTYLEVNKTMKTVIGLQPNNRSDILRVIDYQIPQGVGFQVHLDTTQAFYWETFWIRCFTQSTWDFYDQNAYLQIDLQVIDCRTEWIDIINKTEPLIFNAYQNYTTPIAFDISSKFVSSNPTFCPIVGYRVSKLRDLETNSQAATYWYKDIFIGDSKNVNDKLGWKNLVITETKDLVGFKVFVEAFTGNVSSDVTTHQVELVVEEAPNKAPIFFQEPDSEIFINLNELGNSTTFRKKMPEIYDTNEWDELTVMFFAGDKIQQRISLDLETGILILNDVTDNLIGSHDILINLMDQKKAASQYEITLRIERPAIFQGVVIEEPLEEVKVVEKKVVEKDDNVPVFARISKIDQVGNMTILFSQDMDTSTVELDTLAKSMEIDISPYFIDDDFDQTLLEFEWEIVSFEDDQMDIKLKFVNPLYISMYLVQDFIIVKFNDQYLLKSLEQNTMHKSSTSIVSQIPKQMFDTDQTRNFKDGAIKLEITLNIIFWVILLFNILFSGTDAMDHYVLMINSLQIAMHVPLFSSALPGNVIMYLEKTIPIIMFDIIKEDWTINPTNHFEFDEEHNQLRTQDPRFAAQIADIGYDTHNFMNNVGSVYIFFTLYLLRVVFVGLLKLWTRRFDSGHQLYRKQFKNVFFKDLIVLFVEGYLEFCLAGYLQWTNLEVDKSKFYGERISNIMGNFSIFIACVFIPCSFVYMLTRPMDQLRDIHFQEKYGELYVGLKFESKWTVSYYFVFIIRRLTFLYIAFNAYPHPAQQIQALCLQNLMFSIYIGIVNPRLNKLMHKQELFNEVMIQLCCSLVCLFVGDFVPSQDIKYLFGFILVFIMSALFLMNLLLVFYKASHLIKMIIVKYWHRLGRFLDPDYLKPIKKPKKRQSESTEEEKADQLFLDLQDLVGENNQGEGFGFTFREQDEIIREQVLKELCENCNISNAEVSQQQVMEEFDQEITQLKDLKKKELANDIIHKKQRLQSLMKKNLEEWTTSDSVFWVEYGLKMPEYCHKFKSIPLTGHRMVNMPERELRSDLQIRDPKEWLKLINAINGLKENQNNQKDDADQGQNDQVQAIDDILIVENEFFETERSNVYKSIREGSKIKQMLDQDNKNLSDIDEEENESDAYDPHHEDVYQFENEQNNAALNAFRLQQEERRMRAINQQQLINKHNKKTQRFLF